MSAEGLPDHMASVDLSAHEPVLHIEDEGLDIKAYEIDGRILLDLDWAPESRWSLLDDAAKCKQFVVSWIEGMTGQAMTAAEIEQLKIVCSESGKDLTEDQQSAPAKKAQDA